MRESTTKSKRKMRQHVYTGKRGSRAGPITDDETQEAELDPRDKE